MFEVESFGFFSTDDPVDWQFDCQICWSRIYEYPFAIDRLFGAIHNTSWGHEGIHLVFRDWLDAHFDDVVHSDIRGPEVWDITTPPRDEWLGRFDCLLSISTLEEIVEDHATIIEKHFLPQLKPGGRVIVTFDVPKFQVAAVEAWLGQPIHVPGNLLTPRTSARVDQVLGLPHDFRVGFLVLKAHHG